MPPPSYLQPGYLGAMDRGSYYVGLDQFSPVYSPGNMPSEGIKSGLTTKELGTTLNPMQDQRLAFMEKIREGASKVEFEFGGTQKGNSQQSTPESYGKEEREMMRYLASINDVRTSTHASFNVAGLAGFGQRGFSKEQRHRTIHEVQRAIDFAKDATTGGAIVVHTGEWQRPVTHFYGNKDSQNKFQLYEDEDQEARLIAVDGDTGDFIQDIQKNRTVHVPMWHTAASWGEEVGKDFTGKGYDLAGNEVEIHPDDYVDTNGRKIDVNSAEQLFLRVPQLDRDNTKFKTRTLEWNDLEEDRKDWERRTGKEIATEVYYAKLQIENQILQSKGASLYHLQRYEDELEDWKKVVKQLEYYEEYEQSLPDDQKRLAMTEFAQRYKFVPSEETTISGYLKKVKRQLELQMRYTNESSSAADSRASEFERKWDKVMTVEDYGIKETATAIAQLADEAMTKSKAARQMRGSDEQFHDMYIAPENWHPAQYGSHPDELLNIVKKSREAFKDRLRNHHQINDDKELDRLAKTHIKTTLDIGHLNMWRSMMKKNPKESEEQFQNRFNTWVFDHMQKFHDADAIGHLHLTDNFGYNDEHLSIGQGNTPVKEFVQWMQEKGHTDFIIEPGSFNPKTIMPDAWSYLGAVNWYRTETVGPGFSEMHMAQAGFYAPPRYLVGQGVVPGTDWQLWSQVPLE